MKAILTTIGALRHDAMESSGVNLEDIDKEKAREMGVRYIDTILKFVISANSRQPNFDSGKSIHYLEEMKWRIERPSEPFRNDQEIRDYLNPARDLIIRFNVPTFFQLFNFWEAQIKIVNAANANKDRYDPFTLIDKNRDKIEDINSRFNIVLERFASNSTDEVNIDAVLFMHVQRTESYGTKLKNQFGNLLQKYHLDSEFNAAGIYSILASVIQKKKGEVKHLTDAECIRHALAHNNYKIRYDGNDWTISFDNNREYGYLFKMELTKKQFVDFLINTEILYKATTSLIYLQILWAIVRNRLLVSNRDAAKTTDMQHLLVNTDFAAELND
jgi:hypothetical protein